MPAGDKALWSDVAAAINPPTVRLVAQAAQNLTSGAGAALTFGAGSEDIDTDNMHDTATNPSRITPTLAGYYWVRGVAFFASRADYTILEAWIAKNGSNLAPAGRRIPPLIAGAQSVEAACLVAMNGTTDYVELIALQTNGAAAVQATAAAGRQTSVLELEFHRPL